jgi:hypothetical protein
MLGLADPFLKIGRAKKHLESLDTLLDSFTADRPYTFSRHDDLENQRHILKLKLADVPDDICLTVGDAYYNMRSCLDQLVWSLAKRIGGVIDPERTQFPILAEDTPDTRRSFKDQTKGVPSAPLDEIRGFQPHHRLDYKAHPLWRLNAMCNLDKHRRIPANGSELLVNFPDVTKGIVGIEHVYGGTIVGIPFGLKLEAHENGFDASVPLDQKDKLKMHPTVTFKVNFGGDASRFTENRDGIWEIWRFVNDTVLPRFVRFF